MFTKAFEFGLTGVLRNFQPVSHKDIRGQLETDSHGFQIDSLANEKTRFKLGDSKAVVNGDMLIRHLEKFLSRVTTCGSSKVWLLKLSSISQENALSPSHVELQSFGSNNIHASFFRPFSKDPLAYKGRTIPEYRSFRFASS
jgi:hypothetical protein